MKKHSNQQGFGVVEVIILIVVVALIGVGGWYVWQANNNKVNTQTTNPSSNQYADWPTYTSKEGKFSIKYPGDWKIVVTEDGPAITKPNSTATITSPTGTVVNLSGFSGGLGGACLATPADKPFESQICQSFEYSSADPLPLTNIFMRKKDGGIAAARAYVVSMRYLEPEAGSKQMYAVSLMASIDQPTLDKPFFDLASPVPAMLTLYNAGGTSLPHVWAYAESAASSFLTSTDAATVKTILKSFTPVN